MTEPIRKSTPVVIVGAGPAGLTLANLLQRAGVDCIVLEKQTRPYVEQRQRAGILEYRAAQMFEEWGLGDGLLHGVPSDGAMEFRIDGESRLLRYAEAAGNHLQRLIPQQVLVQRLINTFLLNGGKICFEAEDVALHDVISDRPRVTYKDPSGQPYELICQFIAGCDGQYGASRRTIPDGALNSYYYDHGIGWLTVLAEAQPPQYPLMAVSRYGFAAQFARGPRASRYYLQCQPGEDPASWTDERVWQQLRLRMGDYALPLGPIAEKGMVEMRSLVLEPMSYGRLYLAGDAAHIITPMGGKGMNLALFDAEMLARGLIGAIRDQDDKPLSSYSENCLRRVWDYQEFSRWLTEMLHDAGDDTLTGPFRRRLAIARLNRLFTSPTWARAYAELMVGNSPSS